VIASDRRTTIEFQTPKKPCLGVLSLYLMSNCYMGLDQQYEIPIAVLDDVRSEDLDEAADKPEKPAPVKSVTLAKDTLLQAFKDGPEKARFYE